VIMLVTGNELLLQAQKNKYAIGAFNVNNMEIIQAIISAAEELNSPVILGAFNVNNMEIIQAIISAAEELNSPVIKQAKVE
jgi:fructose/tagatose bisphosphate aldolase